MFRFEVVNVPAESYLVLPNSLIINIKTMKTTLIVLAALFICSTLALGEESRMLQTEGGNKMKILPIKGERNDDNIYDFVDHAIKEKYWYYLTKACLLYLSAVDRTDGSYQFLAIYRNLVGTFLAITTWTKGETTFTVNTLVRLGNGLALKEGANYNPVAVKPLKVRYQLDEHEVIIDFTDCDDIKINGKSVNYYYDCPDCKDKPDVLLIKDCKKFSEYVMEKYWFYLRDAKVVYSTVGKTGKRNFCMITYVNLVGTFFAIGSHCQDETPMNKVNNFVRLGNGQEKGSEAEYEPVKFEKVHLRLKNYVE